MIQLWRRLSMLRARILASQPGARVTVADDIILWQAG